MRLWIDDVRQPPIGYMWAHSVNEAKDLLRKSDAGLIDKIYVIDIDHDAGEYAFDGGDYIKLLDWMEKVGLNDVSIHIHSMNPVGRENMMRIIQKNGWDLIK